MAHCWRAVGLLRTDGVGEAVDRFVVGGVDGDELALQVGGEFGELDAGFGQRAADFVAVGVAFGRSA